MHTSDSTRTGLRALVTIGFLVSGVAGLAYEVLWGRYLGLFVGGTAEAHTLVLATFMGGLAIGNAVFGRLVDKVRNRFLLYAWLELGIGSFCFVFPELFEGLSSVYLALARAAGPGAAINPALKATLAASSLLPPTVLMGGTLPALARATTEHLSEAGARVARLYFLNSIGAAFGAGLAGFWMLEAVGLDGGMRLAAGANLALAAIFFAVGRLVPATCSSPPASDSPPPSIGSASSAESRRRVRLVLAVIAVSGGVSMVYELAWVRLLSLVLGSSTYSFGLMLATFIGGIALGSAGAEALLRRGADPTRALAWAEAGVFASVLAMVPLINRLPFAFHSLAMDLSRTPDAFPLYLLLQVVLSSSLMAIPTILIGATLPFASAACIDDLARMGRRIGTVFSLNTSGTIAGATITGLVLLPTLGIGGTLSTGVALSGACAVALAMGDTRPWHPWARHALRIGLPIAFAAFAIAGPPLDLMMLNSGIYRRRELFAETYSQALERVHMGELLYVADGSNATISVVQDRYSTNRYLKSNGKTEASNELDMATQLWAGHLGPLLHPAARPSRLAMIGLASGVSANAAAAWPDATLDVVEIEDRMVDAARYFEDINEGVLDRPNVHMHLMDAREFFQLAAPGSYDVIVSEPSNPWIAGVGNLFTVRFFETLASRIADDGVVVQWMQIYELDDAIASMVVNTFASVFPYVTLWRPGPTDIFLVGRKQPFALDPGLAIQKMAYPAVAAHLARREWGMGVRDLLDVLALQVTSERTTRLFFPGAPPLNEDDRPLLELRAPRAFFVGEQARLFAALDEKLAPLSESRSFFARALSAAQVPSARVDALADLLEREGRGSRETSVERALRVSLLERRLLESEATPGGTAAAMARATLEMQLLRAGDPAERQRSLLYRRMDAMSPLTGAAAAEAARFEALRLRRLTSILFTPDTAFLDTLLGRLRQSADLDARTRTSLWATAARTYFALGQAEPCAEALSQLAEVPAGERTAVDDPWRRFPTSEPGPSGELSLYLRARLAFDAGNHQEAATALSELLHLDPHHVAARAHLLALGAGRE